MENSLLVQTKTTELTLSVPDADIERLDALSVECAKVERNAMSPFMRTFKMAAGMRQLRDLISDQMMEDIMGLQGSPLGFRTDKDNTTDGHARSGYPAAIVKEVAIEATLRGLRLVGNEVNIIAGRMYAAKDGLRRLVCEWPGISAVETSIGVPRKAEGFTVVPCVASWVLNGEKFTLSCTGENSIPVRVNSDGKGGEQLVDAVIGKATRKLFARIYDRLLGRDAGLLEPDGTAAAAANAALPGPNDEEIKAAVLEYANRIANFTASADVPAILKESSKDARLDDSGRKEVARIANTRVPELRQMEKQNRNRPPQQQQHPPRQAMQSSFIDPSVVDHSPLINEWTEAIHHAETAREIEGMLETVKNLPSPVRVLVERMIEEKLRKVATK